MAENSTIRIQVSDPKRKEARQFEVEVEAITDLRMWKISKEPWVDLSRAELSEIKEWVGDGKRLRITGGSTDSGTPLSVSNFTREDKSLRVRDGGKHSRLKKYAPNRYTNRVAVWNTKVVY